MKPPAPAPLNNLSRPRPSVVPLAVIFFITLLAYSNIFANHFVMDDYDFIVDWPLIQNIFNLPRFFIGYIPPEGQPGIYSPLKTLFHSLTYQMFQLNPAGYHAVSLLVHLVGIFFVYRIALLLTQQPVAAFITGLLFAVHPVHVEAVTYLTASIDTLGIVFLLAAFYFYMKASSVMNSDPARSTDTGGAYGFSIILAGLAVFTHELAVSLPLLLAWFDWVYVQRTQQGRFSWRRLAPFFIWVAVYVLLKWINLGALNRGEYLYGHFSLTMLVVLKAWMRYLYVLFFPAELSFNPVLSPGIFAYDEKDFAAYAALSQSVLDPQVLLAVIVLAAIAWATWRLAPRHPIVLFAVGWFFISLLPGANIIPSSVYFAERYLYPGSVAFCLLLGYGCHYWLTRQRDNPSVRMTVYFLIFCLTVFYAGRTFLRNRDWQDQISLYESAVKTNPQSAFLRNDLGIIYMQQGNVPQALVYFQSAIKLKPDEPHFYFSIEEAYSELELFDQAQAALRRAIELNPEFAEAHYNLAGLYGYLGQRDQAAAHLDRAVRLYRRQNRILEAGEAQTALINFMSASQDLMYRMREMLKHQLPAESN